MLKPLFVSAFGLLAIFTAKTAYGQCWNCYVSPPFVVGPSIIMAPPVIIAPPPVYIQPAPVYVQPAPVYIQPPPVVIEQPAPVYVQPAPQPIAPPMVVETPRYGPQRQCWKQYAGSDNWGQPMYIQACN